MSASANLKRKLELTCTAMKEVVAEQVPKELEKFDKLKNAYDDLNEENAQFVQRNFDLAQGNVQLRRENARYRQLCTEAMGRANYLDIQVIAHACSILHDAGRSIRRLEQTPAQQVPELAATLARARNAIHRAERVLDEMPPMTSEREDEGEDEGGEEEL